MGAQEKSLRARGIRKGFKQTLHLQGKKKEREKKRFLPWGWEDGNGKKFSTVGNLVILNKDWFSYVFQYDLLRKKV